MLVKACHQPYFVLTRLDGVICGDQRTAAGCTTVGHIDKGDTGQTQLIHQGIGTAGTGTASEGELDITPLDTGVLELLELFETRRTADNDRLLPLGLESGCFGRVGRLRAQGEKAGLIKLKMFRPFPVDFFRQVLSGKQKVAVVDRNCSFGASGIFAQELRAALYHAESPPRLFGYIAGLGGRDVIPQTIEDLYWQTKKDNNPPSESIWIGLDQETVESWRN